MTLFLSFSDIIWNVSHTRFLLNDAILLTATHTRNRFFPLVVSVGTGFELDQCMAASAVFFRYWLSRIMPTDTKRVRGPDVSQSPSLFVCKPADLLPTHGPRPDGRQRDQVDVRPVFVRCGLVSQAKGSAYIEAGNTKLMCCVYGPRETERKDETDMKCGRYAVLKKKNK